MVCHVFHTTNDGCYLPKREGDNKTRAYITFSNPKCSPGGSSLTFFTASKTPGM
jgi:hypothetical protein